MNRLQGLPRSAPVFVTLNPPHAPAADRVIHSETYDPKSGGWFLARLHGLSVVQRPVACQAG